MCHVSLFFFSLHSTLEDMHASLPPHLIVSDAVVDITLEGFWKSEWLLPPLYLLSAARRSRCCHRRRRRSEAEMHMHTMDACEQQRSVGWGERFSAAGRRAEGLRLIVVL